MIEGLHIEFKEEYTKEIVKTVIAFCNTGGGEIFIGIKDDGFVCGLENPNEDILKLTNAIRDTIRPDVTMFTTVTIKRIERKDVVVCQVQKGTECPYYLEKKGLRPEGVYVRQGASSVPASRSAILQMIKETDGDSFEELRSLNQDLVFEIFNKLFKENGIPVGRPQLKTLGIIGSDNLYTNLGLLLSDQCQHTIKAAVFEGTTKNQFKDRYEFSGSLLKQMQEVYAFIDRYNRTSSTVVGLKRKDLREYPEQAIREALLNSIVHKDYSYSGSTLVSVFDDRIEILTIGGLVNGLSKNDILIGTSMLRNKHLANVFYRLKWIEAFGTGILKIYESYSSSALHPMIDISDNAFRITLPARKTDVKTIEDLNYRERQILDMFNSRSQLRRIDIQDELQISQPMAVKLLKSLLVKGYILRRGTGKNVFYMLSSHE